MSERNMLVSQMEDGKEYTITHTWADCVANESSIVKKEGNRIFITFKGGDFEGNEQTVYYDIDIINKLEDCQDIETSILTVGDLTEISTEDYSRAMDLRPLPSYLEGKIGMLK